MTAQTVIWKGLSGRSYEFRVFELTTVWNPVGGNYIFARYESGYWCPLYIGQTDNFANRLPHHNEWPCVMRNGVTHIMAHVNYVSSDRLFEERDLVENYRPPCNG